MIEYNTELHKISHKNKENLTIINSSKFKDRWRKAFDAAYAVFFSSEKREPRVNYQTKAGRSALYSIIRLILASCV